MLDDAALQVATATGLHSGIHQTLATGHTVKEVLLRADAGEEAAVDEAAGARARVVGAERRQVLTADHQRRPPALQLDLAQQARDLHAVHLKHRATRHNRMVCVLSSRVVYVA